MRVDSEKCIGCLECVAYCPVGAIEEISNKAIVQINHDKCVECGCCLRSAGCPADALWQQELTWPRILRAEFSNPVIVKATGVTGRGTEETKTNDVTGRYPRGYIGIAVELGRPGIGTKLSDIELVAQAILPLEPGFEKENPTYNLFEDIHKGKLRPGIGEEKVLSAILEFKAAREKAPEIIRALQEVAEEIDTVMSVDIGSRFEPDGNLPADEVARELGLRIRPNGKTNLGLGRPLIRETGEQ